jgi:hypothetical protein
LIENLLNLIRQLDRNAIFSKLDDIEQHGIDLSQFAKQAL